MYNLHLGVDLLCHGLHEYSTAQNTVRLLSGKSVLIYIVTKLCIGFYFPASSPTLNYYLGFLIFVSLMEVKSHLAVICIY